MDKEYHVIGVMSGTSLDGLDLAWCRFRAINDNDLNAITDTTLWEYEIIDTQCIEYEPPWADKLQHAHSLCGLDILLLDKEYGRFIGDSVNDFIGKKINRPQLIASHGHTVFHQPKKGLSFQLGSGAMIHAATNIATVCDFRAVDVALGGQGAPLVPTGDALLFPDYKYCLNLGGIANISFDNKEGKRIAYDICGCNLLLNHLAHISGLKYDEDGKLAKSGQVSSQLLEVLNEWAYYMLPPPKSLDKETMLAECLPIINAYHLPPADKLATITEHIAMQIGHAIADTDGVMLLTGGGAFNRQLVSRIAAHTGVKCLVPDDKLVSYKEALVFAFLGLLRLLGQTNTLASVTGATRDSIGGALYSGQL